MLSGLRILDLTFYLPGPYATLFLADLGAEVVKIENPAGGDPLRGLGPGGGDPAGSIFFQAVNRNKKSVALDLKTPEGREVFLRLAAGADAILEQFRPGVVRRLGIDYEAVRARNSRIAYVSLSGYGQDGPLAATAGHDINYMAWSGLLSLFLEPAGEAGRAVSGAGDAGLPATEVPGAGPGASGIPGAGANRLPLPPIQIADLNGGNLAAIALLAGMLSARIHGTGSYVDVSMTDGLFPLMTLPIANHLAGGAAPERSNLFLAGGEPFYNVYLTADGRFLSVGALEPKFWANLCEVLTESDPERKEASVIARSREEAARVFLTRTAEEWLARLEGLDVCVAPVLTVAEALRGRHVSERSVLVEIPPGKGPGACSARHVRLPLTVTAPSWKPPLRPAPRLGEHSAPVLATAGLTGKEIRDLAARGVLGGDEI